MSIILVVMSIVDVIDNVLLDQEADSGFRIGGCHEKPKLSQKGERTGDK